MDFFKHRTNIDFLRWRWHAMALSSAVIIGGLAMILTGGLRLGIDFSGGTIVILRFEQPATEDGVLRALQALPGEKVVQRYGQARENGILVRLPEVVTEQGASLEQGAVAIRQAIDKSTLGKYDVISTEIVGPVIGEALQRKGIYATLASLAGILLYIAWRFRPSFAVGAVAATLHDVLVTLAFLAFFRYELSLNVVAALLTITGYSVNDTIVIFDRVRENLRSMRRDALGHVVNVSVNQTLSRTVITAGTTFLAVLALFLLGGEVLHGFAFTMLVGIVTGTYSTVFIAAAVAIIMAQWRTRARTQAEALAAAADVKSKKAGRKVRAS
jgi:preprotein translocase subunit SecF